MLIAMVGIIGHGNAALSAPDDVLLRVGEFSSGSLAGWKAENFVGKTSYTLVGQAEKKILCAQSNKSASGLIKHVEIDLNQTPYLNWSWRIDEVFGRGDEKTKQGDDYPARVYVVIDSLIFWRIQSLNYVWAAQASVGGIWQSPFAGNNVKLIAVRSGAARTGRWQSEKRNVRKDLQKAFGKDFARIDAIAIMTDTDNTGGRASACYGDIFFSAQ